MAARPMFRFVGNQWTEVTAATMPVHQPAAVYKALSWNVWFHGCHQTMDEAYCQQVWLPRQRALLDQMRDADVDFLCLQEVTAEIGCGQRPLLSLLLEEEWIRRSYYVSDVTGHSTFSTWYGVVIASRVPLSSFKLLSIPTEMGRSVLVANVNVPAGCPEKIAVATAHLESPGKASSTRLRLDQLKQTLEYLGSTGVTTGLFMGDFNVLKEKSMKECWESLNWRDLNDGSSSWFTGSWRPDRMLLLSSRYVCDGGVAQVVGRRKSGIRVDGPDGVVETPSDHFALLATLRLDASAQPLPRMQASSKFCKATHNGWPGSAALTSAQAPAICGLAGCNIPTHDGKPGFCTKQHRGAASPVTGPGSAALTSAQAPAICGLAGCNIPTHDGKPGFCTKRHRAASPVTGPG